MLLRPARPADMSAVADIHVRAWQQGYRGLLPDDDLDALRPEDRATRYQFGDDDPRAPRTTVAEENGTVLGFSTVTAGPDVAGAGEVLALYVDPARWRAGIGRALLAGARDALAAQGCAAASLWVLAGNERAERLYRHDGWRPDGRRRHVEVWGIEVDEVGYRRALG